MSALGPTTDSSQTSRDVRFVPISEVARLFEHLVGAGEETGRDRKPLRQRLAVSVGSMASLRARSNRLFDPRCRRGRTMLVLWRSSITRLLLRRHYPDAAHLALLNEFNKSNVGLVKRIVPH